MDKFESLNSLKYQFPPTVTTTAGRQSKNKKGGDGHVTFSDLLNLDKGIILKTSVRGIRSGASLPYIVFIRPSAYQKEVDYVPPQEFEDDVFQIKNKRSKNVKFTTKQCSDDLSDLSIDEFNDQSLHSDTYQNSLSHQE